MWNQYKKILVSILAGAMLLTSATAVSAASVWGSRSASMMGTGMTETYAAKTNALSCSDLTGGIVTADALFSKRDLKQEADLSEASYISVEDGQTVNSITNSMMGGGMMGGRH